MTAQNPYDEPRDPQPTSSTDPLGPITLPKRSRVGARAFALVGAASVLAAGALELVENCPTWPTTTISVEQ
ncbi:hypothetical protein [Kribbella catacumbae]|uniref:hypothetical protein n=1 Tax=Kribbella catacumbae TaxID=460086 RepID=UPI000368ED4D|nr:hypothetical protein [Kribbella catacumbae]